MPRTDLEQSEQPRSGSLTVMSWNIRSGFGSFDLPEPAGGTSQLEAVGAVIGESGAEIIGLQEVDRHWHRSGGVDQPRVLAERLGMEWCHGANWLPEGGAPGDMVPQYGTAILSRWPIVEHRNVYLPTPEDWEQRGALIATIRVGEVEMTVINTHLQYGDPTGSDGSTRQRQEQLHAVLDLAAEADAPVVITGDFNATPGSSEMGEIEKTRSGFTDTWSHARPDQPGYTIPASPVAEPERRIDYIFVTDDLAIGDVSVVVNDRTRIASDHFPVVADLTVSSTDN